MKARKILALAVMMIAPLSWALLTFVAPQVLAIIIGAFAIVLSGPGGGAILAGIIILGLLLSQTSQDISLLTLL